MRIFVLKLHAMRRLFMLFTLLLLLPLFGLAQNNETQSYKSAFDVAYEACPDIPRGMLEAISFANTHCYHLTDANYFNDSPDILAAVVAAKESASAIVTGFPRENSSGFVNRLHDLVPAIPIIMIDPEGSYPALFKLYIFSILFKLMKVYLKRYVLRDNSE